MIRAMREQELLDRVIGALERAGIPYLVTGSFASSLQGFPRPTDNVDLVVPPETQVVRELKLAFGGAPEFQLDEGEALRAFARMDAFALEDQGGSGRVVFWPLSDSAFDRSRFARRREEDFQRRRLTLSSPEDTILSKLYWGGRFGGAGKQTEDALGVYEMQYSRLDLPYLRRWAAELGVQGGLAELETRAQRLG